MQKTQIPSTLVRCRQTGFRDSLAVRVLIYRSFHISSHRPAEQVPRDSQSSASSATGRGQKGPKSGQRAFNRPSQDAKPLFRSAISRRPAEHNASAPPKPASSRTIDVRSLAAAPPDVQERLIRKVSAADFRSGALDREREMRDRGSRARDSSSERPLAQRRASTDPRNTSNISSKSVSRKPVRRKYASRKPNADQRPFNDEDLESLKSDEAILRAMIAPKAAESGTYQVSELTLESLHGNGPSMSLAKWGMTELVEEWVDRIAEASDRKREVTEQMAERWKNGDFVPFGDKETKENVLKALENGIPEMSEEDRTAAAQRLREAFGKDFAEMALKGTYVLNGNEDANVPESLVSQISRNASFSSKDMESLVGKVKAMLPPASPSGSQGAARA